MAKLLPPNPARLPYSPPSPVWSPRWDHFVSSPLPTSSATSFSAHSQMRNSDNEQRTSPGSHHRTSQSTWGCAHMPFPITKGDYLCSAGQFLLAFWIPTLHTYLRTSLLQLVQLLSQVVDHSLSPGPLSTIIWHNIPVFWKTLSDHTFPSTNAFMYQSSVI